jgi:uncharacterized protein YndB with AHSA1/START domain
MTYALDIKAAPNQSTITMTREFDAPKALVYRCYTDPELIPNWWGPREYTTTVDKQETRKGGRWRYVQTQGDDVHSFNGVYHDAVEDELLIYTFEYEPMPGHVLLETITFEERDGKTIVTDVTSFQSVEDRDGMMAYGMEEGAKTSMERMDELLATLKQR